MCRFAEVLREAHDAEHLAKFEELLEAAIDLDRIPDEYLVCASYNDDLQVDMCTGQLVWVSGSQCCSSGD